MFLFLPLVGPERYRTNGFKVSTNEFLDGMEKTPP